jgi:hypothetical protein
VNVLEAAAQGRARRAAEALARKYLEASELAGRKAAEAEAIAAMGDEDLADLVEERRAEASAAAEAAEELADLLEDALTLLPDPGVILRRGGREVILALDPDDGHDLVVDDDDDEGPDTDD